LGKIVPGKVLIKPSVAEEKTSGGIYIPESAQVASTTGEVILIGELLGKVDEKPAPDVKVGDNVMYGKYSGTQLDIDGEKYILLSQDDILYIY